MTTLAQQIIETDDKDFNEMVSRLGELEKDEIEFAKIVFKGTKGLLMPATNPEEAQNKATKFVFTIDAPSIIYSAIENKQISDDIPFSTARVPSALTWVEWRYRDQNEIFLIGALISEDIMPLKKESFTYITIFLKIENSVMKCPVLVSIVQTPPFPLEVIVDPNNNKPPAAKVTLRWILERRNYDYYIELIGDVVNALFLLTIPKACEIRDIVHDKKLQNKRIKNGKLPLVEYKTINVKVGVGTPRYKRNGDDSLSTREHSRRRLHDVIGHWRQYERNGTPKVSWVPEHWRGDPELGVILHERRIR